ncbi:hypothetical protein DFH09DRAFT_1087644 [Mycena vulgaris]|nr:hypothetical protein DFH09DRAFT_1087644 [Mycena vulgaris]
MTALGPMLLLLTDGRLHLLPIAVSNAVSILYDVFSRSQTPRYFMMVAKIFIWRMYDICPGYDICALFTLNCFGDLGYPELPPIKLVQWWINLCVIHGKGNHLTDQRLKH